MIGAWVAVVSYCVTKGYFAAIIGGAVGQRPCCCGWLEGSSSIMLTCVECVCCGVIVIVVFLQLIFWVGEIFGFVLLPSRWLWIGCLWCLFVIVVFSC